MRDYQEPQTDRVKRSRQWLVALILAGSPCLAQEPQHGGFGVLPPLPLTATNATPSVRTNPYCAPESEPTRPAVRLTTGAVQASRSVHLSPIGAAIGLNPIGVEQSDTRPAERAPIMTIEPAHQSVVQINPLLKSVHHQNNELVEAKLAPAQPVSHSTPQVAVALPTPRRETAPVRTAGEASILLVTPAPKPLLVVKPQTAIIPVPQNSAQPKISAQAAASTKPLTSASALAKVTAPAEIPTAKATLPLMTPEKTASRLAKTKPVAPAPAVTTAATENRSPKPASATKSPRQTPSGKRFEGASIASMLNQNPQNAAEASEKEKAAPIFFSLSDSTEVAPSKKVLPRSKTINFPSLNTETDPNEMPSVPLTVTVKKDGSIVTAERQKPARAASKKTTIPQPVLAGKNKLGTGLNLPTPTALPEVVSEPKRMSILPDTAKRITPNGKSILSTTGPSTSDDHEKLSVAAVKKFKPRASSDDAKAIKPAKPFSIFGEKAKPMAEATSIIAQSPKAKKRTLTTETDGGKLTLPTPINIDSDIASSKSTAKSGRSVIKVETPSPKDDAKTNPHAELSSTDPKTDLVNPFNRQRDNRTAAAKKEVLPQSTKMNQAVRVEKFKISKDRPRARVNLDSVLEPDNNAKQSPVASGVVSPIALPDSVEKKPVPASVVKTEPAKKSTRATPQAPPEKPTSDAIAASPAINGAEAKKSVLNKPSATPEVTSGTTILRKRYRPPVAVQAIPGTVTRHNAIASNDSPKVQAVPEMVIGDKKTQPPAVDLQQAMRLDTASDLKDRSLVLGPDVQVTPLHMNQAQVRSLTLGGSVRGVRVGDKGVCQAFASGPNQLKLIGTGIGTTRLVVWAQKAGENNEVLMRAFEIHVDEVVPSEGNSIESTTRLLNQSIKKVFPQSQATVQLVRGELWVAGTCESQDSAEKIIRMVRKSCLIPVKDQLTVK